MEINSVYNDKGGVGKTSTCLILGQALASAGYSVLMLDNDKQGSLSVDSLGCNKSDPGLDLVYAGKRKISETIYPTNMDGLFVVPCGKDLKKVTSELEAKKLLEGHVQEMMEELRRGKPSDHFDYVIIDNPPDDTGHPKYCSMEADKIIIPVTPDEVCFSALLRTHNTLETTFPNWDNQKIFIVPTLVMQNRKLHEKYHAAIRKFVDVKERSHREMKPNIPFNTTITSTFVPNVADIPEIIAARKNLFVSRAASRAAEVGRELVLEIFSDIPKDDFNKYLDELITKTRQQNVEKLKRMAREHRDATKKSEEDINFDEVRKEALNG